MLKKLKKEIKKQIEFHIRHENKTAIDSLEYIEDLIKDEEKAMKFKSAGMSAKDWKLLNRLMQKANVQQLEYVKKFADTYIGEKE